MDKKMVDELLPYAFQVLSDKTIGVAENGTIPKTYRGQISSFGVAVSTGSLLAAAAFFNDPGAAKSERHKLMQEINWILKEKHLVEESILGDTLFDTIHKAGKARQNEMKEKVLNCAVALKLAMNLYHLDDGSKKNQKPDVEEQKEG